MRNSFVLAILSTLFLVAEAAAADSVVSFDAKRNLVNKDIEGARWAITQNLGDGTVTGNVFFPGGGEPRFVWCDDVTEPNAEGDEATFSCWGADLCPASPCTPEAWSFLAEVPLARSFFRPEGEVEWVEIGAPAVLARSFFEPPPASASGDRQSGLQITRDGARTMVSKDVGSERWAITQNLDDRTVTGNVFFPDGSDPAFLWCEETAATTTELTYDCRIAEPVVFGPIEDGEGNYFVNQLIGDDGNEGSQDSPFATIEGAVAGLPAGGGKIYVAGGIYRPEDGLLEIYEVSRVELYGSFDPSTWVRDRASFPSTIEGGEIGIEISQAAAITIDGFTIRTEDASGSGGSIGIRLEESRVVTISRNTILTGDGAPGSDGGEQIATRQPGDRGSNGAGGAVCISPTHRNGGGGGDGGNTQGTAGGGDGGNGGRGRRGSGNDGASGDAQGTVGGGGGTSSGANGGPGPNGPDGGPGTAGGAGGSDRGRSGRSGALGDGGAGGGGGAGGSGSSIALTCGGGGGGGGGGGQGGGGGRGGRGGGNSVGIVIEGGDAEIRDNLIVTGDGGRGGAGGLGADGAAGGAGGSGGAATALNVGKKGGNGGPGGRGGRGGDGGSGGGGSAIGIYLDDESLAVYERNAFELGRPGDGGMNPESPEITYGEAGRRQEVWDRGADEPGSS